MHTATHCLEGSLVVASLGEAAYPACREGVAYPAGACQEALHRADTEAGADSVEPGADVLAWVKRGSNADTMGRWAQRHRDKHVGRDALCGLQG